MRHSIILLSAKTISFTFRELRRFRSVYLCQNILEHTPIPTTKKEGFFFSFYGNAEAISPQQRRLFRGNDQLKKTNFNTLSRLTSWEQGQTSIDNSISNDKISSLRKISVFPVKRAKRVYGLNSFISLKTWLQGSLLYAVFHFYADKSNFEVSFRVSNLFQDLAKQLVFSNTIFRFSPSFITINTVKIKSSISEHTSFFARSYYSWNKYLSSDKHKLIYSRFAFVHLSFISSRFIFSTFVCNFADYSAPILKFKQTI